ncbi:hypothetical protein SLEP1_g44195 [Rubroshorea leprosula]|uniref:Uncharacterized protein n=1 Tax=Rubroshorea leprosula TaxID=152421 RepID=A0AAV5LFF6_9ROSI|nr:hypothetical protein SLEP1_g44195 [Rubroshorea leprosula]
MSEKERREKDDREAMEIGIRNIAIDGVSKPLKEKTSKVENDWIPERC